MSYKNIIYDVDINTINFVPFDIETTGFKASENDIITTISYRYDDSYYILINTDQETDESTLESKIKQQSQLNVVLDTFSSEYNLLHSFSNRIHEIDSAIFIAFNGETYRGSNDFDLPFLRTRYLRNGLNWSFRNKWYTDLYEVYSQKNRFNTTVTEKPSIDNLTKSERIQFINDMSLDIHYDKMNKSEIVQNLNQCNLSVKSFRNWVGNNLNYTDLYELKYNDLKKSELKRYIDNKNLNISYKKLSSNELKEEILNNGYSKDMIIDWYEKTDRELGTTDVSTLDEIHNIIIESNNNIESLSTQFDIVSSFDPYDDSSEAVTGFENNEYVDLGLHCLSDVMKSWNLIMLIIEYVSKKDYQPKQL